MANQQVGRSRISRLVDSFRIGCLALAALLAVVSGASGQTVLARARTGNNLTAMTYVDNGPLENTIVFVDGYQLRSVSAAPCRRHCGADDLLDLKVLHFGTAIEGLAYVSAEKKFVLWDPATPDSWWVLDRNAQPLAETRTVTHLSGLGENGVDGMVYVPSSARRYGDRVLALVGDSDGVTHIEVIKRNGKAVGDIVPQGDLQGYSFSSIGYKAPDRLLLTTYDNTFWEIDFDGNPVSGPIEADDVDLQGVIQTADGKVVTCSYLASNLIFFDRNFNRLPGLDRDVKVGIGKSLPYGVAWDPDTQSVLINPWEPGFVQELDAMPVSMDCFVKIADFGGLAAPANGLTYLAKEHRIGVAQFGSPRAVLLFDNQGTQTEEIDIQDPDPRGLWQVSYVPTRQQFAYRIGLAAAGLLHFGDRHGNHVGDLDLSGFGITGIEGLVWYPAAKGDPNPAGNVAVSDGPSGRVFFMDVDGTTSLGDMDYRSASTLNMKTMRLGYISNGPLKGAFLGLDRANSEIVIFRR